MKQSAKLFGLGVEEQQTSRLLPPMQHLLSKYFLRYFFHYNQSIFPCSSQNRTAPSISWVR